MNFRIRKLPVIFQLEPSRLEVFHLVSCTGLTAVCNPVCLWKFFMLSDTIATTSVASGMLHLQWYRSCRKKIIVGHCFLWDQFGRSVTILWHLFGYACFIAGMIRTFLPMHSPSNRTKPRCLLLWFDSISNVVSIPFRYPDIYNKFLASGGEEFVDPISEPHKGHSVLHYGCYLCNLINLSLAFGQDSIL